MPPRSRLSEEAVEQGLTGACLETSACFFSLLFVKASSLVNNTLASASQLECALQNNKTITMYYTFAQHPKE